jgi:hypothetical protein
MSKSQKKNSKHIFKNVSQFKRLETKVKNQNLTHEEIKKRKISDSACYHSVQNKKLNTEDYNFAGARGSVVVKSLCYKSEGRGFDTR